MAAATGPDGKIYAISGFINAVPTTTTVVEIFDPRTNIWSTGTPIPVAVQQSGGIGAGNGVFVFGGYDCGPTDAGNSCGSGGPAGTFENSGQFLSQSTGTWSGTPTPPINLSYPFTALGPSGVFYMPVGDPATATLKFNPSGVGAGGSWSAGPSLPAVTYAPAVTSGLGTIYVIAGADPQTLASAVPDTYTLAPGANAWAKLVPAITTPRCALGAASDGLGNIYAIGGDNCAYLGGTYTIYSIMEIYSPNTKTWSPGPTLPNGVLTQFGTTVGLEGRIYVIGGWDGQTDTTYFQVYDPVAGYWIP
jgi:N-acetylneuraminic acid mutarotase